MLIYNIYKFPKLSNGPSEKNVNMSKQLIISSKAKDKNLWYSGKVR